MKTALFVTSFVSMGATALAWTPATPSSSRRIFLDQAAKVVPLVLVADAAFAEEEAAAPVVEGEAVAEAVVEEPAAPEPPLDENEFIAKLKARSIANKDKYKAMAESNDKLSLRQFKSQYDRPSFVGIHYPDSERVTMVLKEDLQPLLDNGSVKLTYESKVSKKTGEISDDYSKPIYIYTN